MGQQQGADQSGGKDACTGSASVDGNMGDRRVCWAWRRCGYVSRLRSIAAADCRKTRHDKFEAAVIGWGFGPGQRKKERDRKKELLISASSAID
ncbi:hypothetical protein DVH24_010846 [Malus domestica]|uniref:Uncharacterized protein n=1 Tax=Malus domestica TaxID=3750 RepID=A0A498JZB8_MALDO|nr:hypothetical protein DVH24_010846 [Malus domestica]